MEEFSKLSEGRLVGYLGIVIVEATPDRAVATLDYHKEITMPYGMVHGGAIATLADTAAGFAMATTLGPGQAFTTLEFKMNMLRPVREGTITAVAAPVHRGSRTSVYEVRVTDSADKLVALFTCTELILDAAGWARPTS